MKKINSRRTSAPIRLRIQQSTALVALALASMSAQAGPGAVCLDGVSAVAQCTSGTIRTFYANSPQLRKFVDTLPGLTAGNSNTFAIGATQAPGEYIPIAVADTKTYPGSDYYVIAVVEHKQRMHSDLLDATQLRSYVQIYPQGQANQPFGSQTLKDGAGNVIYWKDATGKNTAEPVYAYDKPHYLGPVIVANKGTPVRVTLVNLLPTGSATLTNGLVTARNGDLLVPVDESLDGAGAGNTGTAKDKYSQNRVALHLHGGDSPWISDGTPHQWITPAFDPTPFKKGDRQVNVPDMPYPGDGAQTLYWPNNQSARLMWYHDHTMGLTRQNAYVGEAAGYLIRDAAEQALINGGTVGGQTIGKAIPGGPNEELLLVLQDKTFVPTDIATQDAKWNEAAWGKAGSDLWYPHVYEPNQIWAPNGTFTSNPAGRWDYATDALGAYQPPAAQLLHNDPDFGSVAFPDGSYADGTPGKGPSAVPESYMDTPVVNGVAYPVLHVQPKAYRVRFLNGSNDRYWNLSLWVADPAQQTPDGRLTEVRMVTDPTQVVNYTLADGSVVAIGANRPGGVPDPDPLLVGPNIIQFGNEAGLLSSPVVHTPKPISGTVDPLTGSLTLARGADFFLGNAERADTVIDFSQHAGKTLILYNDASAPVPAGDSRYDYYTGGPDLSTIGGAPTTLAGFGPNTRTVMQIVVDPLPPNTTVAAYDPVGNGGALASELPKAFAASAEASIATGISATNLPVVNLATNTISLSDGDHPLQVKTIEGFTDPNFGRLIAQIGAELPDLVNVGSVIATPLAYVDKPTEIIHAGDTQYWLIKNNDGDNHPMHFHLFNVQVLARIDQATKAVSPPQADEVGWKETVKNWPGEDLVVALRPKTPQVPFGVPNSVRLMDPTLPAGAYTSTAAIRPGSTPQFAFLQADLTTGQYVPVSNTTQDYGWEYVWHCHILGHEENDLMRPIVYHPVIQGSQAPTNVAVDAKGLVTWTDPTPAGGADANGIATLGNPGNEIGFSVQRVALKDGQPVAKDAAGAPVFSALPTASTLVDSRVNTLANATSFQDKPAANTDYLYRVVAINAAGETASNNVATLAQAPAAPTALTAAAGSVVNGNSLQVNLQWSDNASNETGYLIQRDGLTIGGAPANATSFVDSVSAPFAAAGYRYTVAAQKTGFADSAAASVVFKPSVVLAAPAGLAGVYNATAKTIALSWTDGSVGETGYVVKRATGTVNRTTGAVTWGAYANRPTATTVLAANSAAVVDTGIAANTLYQYQVTAMNGVTAGPMASLITATATSLTAPSKLQSTGAPTVSTMGLQWENSLNLLTTGYEVQSCADTAARCALPTAVWLPQAGTLTVGASTSKFVASGLKTKTSYTLRVRAISNVVPGTLLSSPWTAGVTQVTL